MKIKNKERWPGIAWETSPHIIGSVGAEALWLIGYEEGSNAAIVARSFEAIPQELAPCYLYELLSQQDPVTITEALKPLDTP
ncbi:hypothetical protein ACN4EG_20560 [Alkalinema pantanalense CENA528]|uniref:hypothetical protein n=1 Tax=Alkalinema pantanalense TaxID=1620705 RepID=UPI003D6E579A